MYPLQTESNPVSFLIEICCSPQRRGLKSMHVFSLNCSKALKMTPFAFISKVTQMKNLLKAVKRKRCWLLSLYKTCSYPGSSPNNRGRVGASGAVHCEWTSSSWSKTRRHQWISWIYILSWATILQWQTNNNNKVPSAPKGTEGLTRSLTLAAYGSMGNGESCKMIKKKINQKPDSEA